MSLRFALKIPEIIRTSTFIIKKVKTVSKLQIPQSKSLSELQNLKAEVSLKTIP